MIPLVIVCLLNIIAYATVMTFVYYKGSGSKTTSTKHKRNHYSSLYNDRRGGNSSIINSECDDDYYRRGFDRIEGDLTIDTVIPIHSYDKRSPNGNFIHDNQRHQQHQQQYQQKYHDASLLQPQSSSSSLNRPNNHHIHQTNTGILSSPPIPPFQHQQQPQSQSQLSSQQTNQTNKLTMNIALKPNQHTLLSYNDIQSQKMAIDAQTNFF